MKSLLITDIAQLAGLHPSAALQLRGSEMANLPVLGNAWLLLENGRIKSFGPMDQLPELAESTERISANGGCLLPSWCDSHTHLVFAASREEEFVMKIKGKSYEEIAAAGGAF